MLNIMLVDDERLVRAGLKHSIDWERVGMHVSDEAESVSQALEHLSKHPDIDLIFTDIIMPGQTGLDLIRILSGSHPNLPVVIMSYHDDFAYVQEALRLGAIDYIHKSEIELDIFYVTLQRISEAVQQRRENNKLQITLSDYVQALMVIGMPGFMPQKQPECTCLLLGHDNYLMLYKTPTNEKVRIDIESKLSDRAILLLFDDISQMRLPDILYESEIFMSRDYFYRALPNLRIYEPEITHALQPTFDSQTFHWIEEQLYSLEWLDSDSLYLKILSTIQRLRLSPNIVANLFFGVRLKWLHLLENDAHDTPFQRYDFWYQWTDWISGFRRTLIMQSGCSKYSPEILTAIQRVMLFLESHFTENISVSQAAEIAALSESYFAKCFREITRKSFHNYLRTIRLSYARKLLISSRISIAQVAERSGFPDSFHFIRLFKAQYGMTPGNYRLNHTNTLEDI